VPTDDATRLSYDAVAERYAEAFADELAERPLERGLLDAFVELTSSQPGRVVDVGCGPGHVTRYLVDRGADALGVDLSPGMIEIARKRYGDVEFRVGSLIGLDFPAGSLAGAVALYSIIHLSPGQREVAYAELARIVRVGGWLLVSIHVSTATQAPGSAIHLDSWLGSDVDLTGWFIDPDEVARGLGAVGFSVRARLDREPWSDRELASRRAYLLARR